MPIRFRTAAALFAACLLAGASQAMAWNNVGHEIVAVIAWDQLDAQTKAELFDILKAHPHFDDKSVKGGNFLSVGAPDEATLPMYAFVRSATWPDAVRPSRNPMRPVPKAVTQYHHGDWHYVDMPYDPAKPLPAGQFPTPNNGNLLNELPIQLATLKNPTATKTEKAIALSWVEHLIGDEHQPLHATTVVDPDFPEGDQGGNKEKIITADGDSQNLHGYWDSILGTDTDWDKVTSEAHDIESTYPASSLPELKTDTTALSWAHESYTAAIKYVYMNGKIVNHGGNPTTLPPSYEGAGVAVARKRVAEAGYRLADAIKDALKDYKMSGPTTMPAMAPASAPAP
jgi:hypothetical protein